MKNYREEYLKLLKPLDIILIGDYTYSKTKTSHKCLKCSNVWFTRPQNIKRGGGCPKCVIERQRKPERYISNLPKTIKMVGNYISAHKKVKHQCLTCNNIWDVVPNSISKGNGCPKCGYKKSACSNTLTNEEYDSQIKNLTIKRESPYINHTTDISHKCLECGSHFMSSPRRIKNGKKCPYCFMNNMDLKRYKSVETTLYLIDIKKVGIKPGLHQEGFDKRFASDDVEYDILFSIHYKDGFDALKKEKFILEGTKEFKIFSTNINGPLRTGNTEIRSYDSLPMVLDYYESLL